MPKVKIVNDVWQLLLHVLSYGYMPVCYNGANRKPTSKKKGHAVFEAKELHSCTATSNISLKKKEFINIKIFSTMHSVCLDVQF